MNTPIISLAPLQGITDYHFRTVFYEYFAGVKHFYTPYLRLLKDGSIKNSQQKDVAPENNRKIALIPQIMTNKVNEFLFFDHYLFDLGYSEINWNLGCPFPMVTNKKLGAGMLEHPNLLNKILDRAMPKLKCKLSVKMRVGNLDENEFKSILPVLNNFPLSEIIVHPRIGKQLYKGKANSDIFEEMLSLTQHKLAYNGDIDSIETFQMLQSRFPSVEHWMIGRKLIANPFLASDILSLNSKCSDRKKHFQSFHDNLFEIYSEKLEGSGHLLSKMLHLWEYFSDSFTNSKKVYKRIKKAKNIYKYDNAIAEIFNNEEFIA